VSDCLYKKLSWLPAPPSDFSERCRALLTEPTDAGRKIQRLASYSLDLNQLTRLAKTIEKLIKTGASLAPLIPFKLGLLSNATVDFIVPSLVGSAARHGIVLEVISADYGQAIQEALSPESRLNVSKPDAVLLAIDYRGLPLRPSPASSEGAQASIRESLDHLNTIATGIKGNNGAVCIFQTLAAPPEGHFGSLDRILPGTMRYLVDGVNRAIGEVIFGSGDIVLDVASIAETVGLSEWHCTRQWNLGKFPFSELYLPLYAEHLARILGAIRGKSRRCLILDLDNTVWGGVIGDDGLEGIQLAQGDSTGEAYLAVQQLALALRDRGIVLAVSSKNEDEIARLPFRRHPEMLLREEDIAVFQANWNDKATNIKAIAEELSLGLDAMVFLDDNPVERGLVRQMLPQVAVPELPDDPALYARTLAAAGYFESIALLKEDLQRAGFYRDNARRVTLQKNAGGLDAYLESLAMEITFQPFDETGRARITQLVNKSNQFNLTTRRYTESEIAAVEHDPTCFTLQVRLADTFGDNGMISVIICRPAAPGEWEIDTWLMSCRVLGRRVENMVLQEIVENARQHSIHTIKGAYIPTDRNKLVAEHYRKLGFTEMNSKPNGGDTTLWELDVDTPLTQTAPMTVKRIGFPEPVGYPV
jgi:FkbH-like protein